MADQSRRGLEADRRDAGAEPGEGTAGAASAAGVACETRPGRLEL
jgi:hypothetical protein